MAEGLGLGESRGDAEELETLPILICSGNMLWERSHVGSMEPYLPHTLTHKYLAYLHFFVVLLRRKAQSTVQRD